MLRLNIIALDVNMVIDNHIESSSEFWRMNFDASHV